VRELRRRPAEHEASRRRAGITVERAYRQRNPDGSALVVAYVEAGRGFGDVMGSFIASNDALDRYFIDKNSEVTGVDFRAGPMGPEPELVGAWSAPSATSRGRGIAFAAPLQAGKTEQARRFAREAYVDRRNELGESRLSKGITREEVYLNRTPMGDLVVVYAEGDDPVEGNRQFASSQSRFDRWFKDSCKEIFPPYVDFDQPVPANEELFSWTAT
jgi:hypothetical protein